MELVTGYRGMNHVTAEQLADLQAGVLGYDSCVLNIGEKLRADVVTSNKIRIFDGVFIFNGKQAMIEAGDYEDITIENGTIGLYRNDIIVVDYKKDEATGIENTTLKVLKGNTAEEPTDPVYTTNDIRSGAFESEIPLYRVRLNGLAIEKLDPLYAVAENIASLNISFANSLNSLIDNLTAQNITSSVQVSAIVNQSNVYFYKISNLVVLVGRLHVTLTTEESIIFQLPVKARHTINFVAQHIEGNYNATGAVYPDGNVRMRSRSGNLTGNEWFYILVVFPDITAS